MTKEASSRLFWGFYYNYWRAFDDDKLPSSLIYQWITLFIAGFRWRFYCLTTHSINIFFFIVLVSASYVPGPMPDSTRSRHAPLYGRLVSEEHLPASHRDVHQVRPENSKVQRLGS